MSESPITGYTKAGADAEFVDEGELAEGLGEKADVTALLSALPAALGAANLVLKMNAAGDAVVWSADTNTTYTIITNAEAVNSASTTARLVSGQRLAEAVAAFAPVKSAGVALTIPAVPVSGNHTLQAVEGVLTWIEVVP